MKLLTSLIKWLVYLAVLLFIVWYFIYFFQIFSFRSKFSVLGHFFEFFSPMTRGFGISPIFFVFAIVCFLYYLKRLRKELDIAQPDPVEIQFWDHKSNQAISWNFAIGIGFTAYGMIRALWTTIGDLPDSMDEIDPLGLLTGLVEGGMILALATTIAGMIIGYALRYVKHHLVGKDLYRLSVDASRELIENFEKKLDNIHQTLLRIERGRE